MNVFFDVWAPRRHTFHFTHVLLETACAFPRMQAQVPTILCVVSSVHEPNQGMQLTGWGTFSSLPLDAHVLQRHHSEPFSRIRTFS